MHHFEGQADEDHYSQRVSSTSYPGRNQLPCIDYIPEDSVASKAGVNKGEVLCDWTSAGPGASLTATFQSPETGAFGSGLVMRAVVYPSPVYQPLASRKSLSAVTVVAPGMTVFQIGLPPVEGIVFLPSGWLTIA